MNFLDSLLDKIPIIRDMEKKKRMLAAGFVVFAVISILGIIIDAIAETGGVVALISVALGFLLMAAIIIADFIMSKSSNKEKPPQNELYNFFEDSSDEFSYQNESYDYQSQDNLSDTAYDDRFKNENSDNGYANESYSDDEYDGNYRNNFSVEDQVNGNHYQIQPQNIEYTITNEAAADESTSKRFGGVFHRGVSNENTAISDEINNMTAEAENINSTFAGGYNNEYKASDSSFEFTQEESYTSENTQSQYESPVQLPYSNQAFGESIQPNQSHQDDYIGEPVITFPNAQHNLSDEVSSTADFVAPNIVPPTPSPSIVGGPVMSIPSKGYQPIVTERPQPTQSYTPTVQQPAYTTDKPEIPAYQQGVRGQEIEDFFDNMSDDELLYSDCVEVWASDAKPAAIRLLKQIESLSDKKMADSLGREAEYVNAMIDRIYYFTMLDSIKDNLELKKYNFSIMVKECLRRFSPFFMEKRIGLLWKGLDIDIVTDKRWLIFALTQVIFNAVEFTGLGGKIAISAKKEGSLIHLMVDDDGCGISEDDKPHIFMAGFMGDNVPNESGRRTGMGLFITRSVVEKLGGTVTAESAIGKGTRITIILPENQ